MKFIDKWLCDRRIKALEKKLYFMPVCHDDILYTNRPITVQILSQVNLTNVCDSLGILDIEA